MASVSNFGMAAVSHHGTAADEWRAVTVFRFSKPKGVVAAHAGRTRTEE